MVLLIVGDLVALLPYVSSREIFAGLSRKERTSNQPCQSITHPCHFDLPLLLVVCGPDDQAFSGVFDRNSRQHMLKL